MRRIQTQNEPPRPRRPDGAAVSGGNPPPDKEPPPLFRDFGDFLSYFLPRLGLSQTRAANLAGVDTFVISKIIHHQSVSDAMIFRIMIALLKLSVEQLRFLNLGLASAGRIGFPIPGETVTSHAEHDRLKRGGIPGKRFGNRATENARAERPERESPNGM